MNNIITLQWAFMVKQYRYAYFCFLLVKNVSIRDYRCFRGEAKYGTVNKYFSINLEPKEKKSTKKYSNIYI